MTPDPEAIGADLVARVKALVEQSATLVGATDKARLTAVGTRLDQPVTIAVAGRTNAGKSTLVNALIGHRVAPTRATECTKVVTWYRFGNYQDRVVRRRDHPAQPESWEPLYPGPNGELPDTLGVPVDEVDRVEVWLSFKPLARMTVIDTPGLSGDEGLADQTERLLGAGDADVLIFVLRAAIGADEAAVINDFRAATAQFYDFAANTDGFAGNAFGVMSRADVGGDGGDPWPGAMATAERHSEGLSDRLAGVLPVMGLIAETTQTGELNEDATSWLRHVAELDGDDRDNALLFADDFIDILEGRLPPGAAQRLLDRLDMHGIRVVAATATEDTSTEDVREHLLAVSGYAALRRRIDALFVRPACIHHIVRALAVLDGVIASAGLTESRSRSLRAEIAEIRRDPTMHTVAELRALAMLYSGRCALTGAAAKKALSLWEEAKPAARLGADPDTPNDQLVERARRAISYWHTRAASAFAPREKQLYEIAERSATNLYLQLKART
jgi:hypothetical protein